MLADELNMRYAVVSAKTSLGVDELFAGMGRTAVAGICKRADRLARLSLPVMVTVLAVALECEVGVELRCFSLSGAELGSFVLEDVGVACEDILSQLRQTCGIEAAQVAKFVTQQGFVLPALHEVQYEESRTEMVLLLNKEDMENIEGHCESIFEAEGLLMEDVHGEPVLTDVEGNIVSVEGEMQEELLHFPLTLKCLVKRRRQPMTVSDAFGLDSSC